VWRWVPLDAVDGVHGAPAGRRVVEPLLQLPEPVEVQKTGDGQQVQLLGCYQALNTVGLLTVGVRSEVPGAFRMWAVEPTSSSVSGQAEFRGGRFDWQWPLPHTSAIYPPPEAEPPPPEAEPMCLAGPHLTDAHVAISARFCAATIAKSFAHSCVFDPEDDLRSRRA